MAFEWKSQGKRPRVRRRGNDGLTGWKKPNLHGVENWREEVRDGAIGGEV